MKFAHLGDCHLGSWRQPELQELNLQNFKKAIQTCIKEKVDFVLIAGDLFDSAYPPIEILKETFAELKKLKDESIPCFIIAGSHDYSASGKTFIDVLEKAGLCKNCFSCEEKEGKIILNPIVYKDAAIYGYPGKKSGLEVQDIKKITLQDSPGFFKILMLHTTIDGAKGSLPIDSVDETKLPKADYYALAHLHIDYCEGNCVYSGPIFPNNFQELEELKFGSFYIIDTQKHKYEKIQLKTKDVEYLDLEIKNALIASEKIISELKSRKLKDKIVLIRLSGRLEKGKLSNINFVEIEKFAKDNGAFSVLRSTTQIKVIESEISTPETDKIEEIEEQILVQYSKENPSELNKHLPVLMKSLTMEKQEDEKTVIFTSRLVDEIKKILSLPIE